MESCLFPANQTQRQPWVFSVGAAILFIWCYICNQLLSIARFLLTAICAPGLLFYRPHSYLFHSDPHLLTGHPWLCMMPSSCIVQCDIGNTASAVTTDSSWNQSNNSLPFLFIFCDNGFVSVHGNVFPLSPPAWNPFSPVLGESNLVLFWLNRLLSTLETPLFWSYFFLFLCDSIMPYITGFVNPFFWFF